MKLELKHLAPYLPYGLKFYWENLDGSEKKQPWELKAQHIDFAIDMQNKPILRPLSDLTKEIEVNGEKFVPLHKIQIYESQSLQMLIHNILSGFVEIIVFDLLLKWHFDVFGLIEKGLAIDINTLKN